MVTPHEKRPIVTDKGGERGHRSAPPSLLLLEMVLLRKLGAGVALRSGTAVEHAEQLRRTLPKADFLHPKHIEGHEEQTKGPHERRGGLKRGGNNNERNPSFILPTENINQAGLLHPSRPVKVQRSAHVALPSHRVTPTCFSGLAASSEIVLFLSTSGLTCSQHCSRAQPENTRETQLKNAYANDECVCVAPIPLRDVFHPLYCSATKAHKATRRVVSAVACHFELNEHVSTSACATTERGLTKSHALPPSFAVCREHGTCTLSSLARLIGVKVPFGSRSEGKVLSISISV